MATLAEDGDSWKAGGVKRRDFRNIKNGPEVPRRNGKKKKKDTKKWCRGKEGKEHNLVHMKVYNWMHVDRCSDCGKDMNHYYSSSLAWASGKKIHYHTNCETGKNCFF